MPFWQPTLASDNDALAYQLSGLARFTSLVTVYQGARQTGRLISTCRHVRVAWDLVVAHWTQVAAGEPGLFPPSSDVAGHRFRTVPGGRRD